MKDFIPSDHFFAMLRQDLLQPLIKICLQRRIIFQSMARFKSLNLRIAAPLFSVNLIAPDVEILIWKKFGHFTDEGI